MTRSALFDDQHGPARRRALAKMQRAMRWRQWLKWRPKFSSYTSGRDLAGMVVVGLAIGFVVIAVIRVPVLDAQANEKLQRLAEARMKARLFTKYPDPAIAQMSAPVSTSKENK